MNDPQPRNRTGEDAALLEAQQDQQLLALGMLAAGVAHDFNNMLTAILGHASILAETLPPEHPERGSIEEIIVSSQQAAGLARQLLTFTRASRGQRERIDLNEVARDAHSLLRRVIGVNVRLQLELDPDLPRVAGDSVQIAQVLMNLIMNARDALPGERGHVWIRTGRHFDGTDRRGRGFGLLEVEDDGIGMNEEVQARIFEPFFSTRKRQGTGLGMAIVKSVVEHHEGRISVESEPGRGTRIRILLPLFR